jgi:hypothetical protein
MAGYPVVTGGAPRLRGGASCLPGRLVPAYPSIFGYVE